MRDFEEEQMINDKVNIEYFKNNFEQFSVKVKLLAVKKIEADSLKDWPQKIELKFKFFNFERYHSPILDSETNLENEKQIKPIYHEVNGQKNQFEFSYTLQDNISKFVDYMVN